jgi:hypothetical protein
MGCSGIKDDIQTDVKCVIIHRASILFGQRTSTKVDNPSVVFQIFMAGVQ